MKYEMVVRHEPQTCMECEEGWWYEHYLFDAEKDKDALKEAKSLCDKIGEECSKLSVESVGYGCYHSVDELYCIREKEKVSIYNDGVYQCILWDSKGKENKIKRVTDGTIINFLRTRLAIK